MADCLQGRALQPLSAFAIGRRLPVRHDRLATALGAASVVGGLQAAGLIPLIGDLIVAAVALTGLGAVVVTYSG